jgi:tRNA-dihydrouridine synthase C
MPKLTYPLDKHLSGCPRLFLAPMEGVGDRPFRKAMVEVGGFDEACTEFIRVPVNAHVESLAKVYDSNELVIMPLAAQIMGQDPDLCAAMGKELEKRGAKRIELNCGCPSNTVTGKGAGSSLLKDPELLYKIGCALVSSCDVPVSIKMRAGYEDTTLFHENLKAAEDTGACFITLHARTKKDGYVAPAKWELIAEAKSLLTIPLVGNGDIKSPECAKKMLEDTGCDALMIGRAACSDPFIFHKIKASFESKFFQPSLSDYMSFLHSFANHLNEGTPSRTKVNKLKQIINFMLKKDDHTESYRIHMLRFESSDPAVFLKHVEELLSKAFF